MSTKTKDTPDINGLNETSIAEMRERINRDKARMEEQTNDHNREEIQRKIDADEARIAAWEKANKAK